jgi:tetratricopeptide (TPR) repeat protein
LSNLVGVQTALHEYEAAKSYADSALSLARLVSNRGIEAASLSNLGSIYLAQGEQVRAIAYYEQALLVFEHLGDERRIKECKNNIALARRTLNGELNVKSGGWSFGECSDEQYAGEAMRLANGGHYEEAIESVGKAIAINENNAEYHYFRGVMLLELTRYDEALEAFGHAILLRPSDARFYYNRGCAHAAKEEHRAARDDFSHAITHDNKNIDSYFNRGVSSVQLGDYEAGLTDFQSALSLQNDPKDIHRAIGLTLLQMGKLRDALPHLNLAVEDDGK